MNRVYFCIDLKSFYASVECVLRGLDPFKTDLIVADKKRGKNSICLAVSPKMKTRGVKNRCRVFEIPKYIHPIIAKPRMKKYIEYSARIYAIYLKYIDKNDIHPYSIDEMFLDVTNYLKLYQKSPIELAKTIMKDIYDTTGITATAGIGTNLFLAKVALDITAKHDKSNIGILDEEKFKKELWHHLPLTDFWRIGEGVQSRLNKLHLKDLYDVAHCDEKILYKEFGITAEYLIDHAWGRESCTIKEIKDYKPSSNSISNGQILFKDYDFEKAKIVFIEMIDNLVLELVKKGLYTQVVGFYIGYSKNNHQNVKASFKLEYATSSFNTIMTKMKEEYEYRVNPLFPIRRINIWFGNLTNKKIKQLNFFTNSNEEDELKVEKAISALKNKYGKNIILRAISFEEGANQIERNKLIGGHNAQ